MTGRKDAIKDAAIDTFLYELKKCGEPPDRDNPVVQWGKACFSTEDELLQKLPDKAQAAFPWLKASLVEIVNSYLAQLAESSQLHKDAHLPEEFDTLWKRVTRRFEQVWEAITFEDKEEKKEEGSAADGTGTENTGSVVSAAEDPFLKAAASLPVPTLPEASSLWPVKLAESEDDDAGELQPTEHAALGRLTAAISGQRTRATFACSGSIAISPDHVAGDSSTHPPVQLRWGPTSQGAQGHTQFPCPSGVDTGDAESSDFEKLLQACRPATFGKCKEDVFDETYRKAAKMGALEFCTNFDPHAAGIIDSVHQVLLPSLSDAPDLGTVAELYSLNVYSAPLGKFKPHADTPRGAHHYASLVVCLPFPHQGGGLAVRHESAEHVFDWTQTASTQIQWTAFYRDCEHEVFEVQEGHRVTLTYNLFFAPRVGLPIQPQNPSIDASRTELYQLLKGALEDPAFLPYGKLNT